jgi:hypothetical protein
MNLMKPKKCPTIVPKNFLNPRKPQQTVHFTIPYPNPIRALIEK